MDKEIKTAAELGHWEGPVFVYTIPVELPNGAIIKKIDISQASLLPGVTPDDAVEAIANNISVEEA